MTDITLENFLLNQHGVTRFDLNHLHLRRYLLHDVPFAIVEKGAFLHIRLDRANVRKLSNCFKGKVSASDFYDSRYWVMLPFPPNGVPDQAIFDALSTAYLRVLYTLSPLSLAVYDKQKIAHYDLDYRKVLQDMRRAAPINYGKRIIDFD